MELFVVDIGAAVTPNGSGNWRTKGGVAAIQSISGSEPAEPYKTAGPLAAGTELWVHEEGKTWVIE